MDIPDIEIDREKRSRNYLPKIMMLTGTLILGGSLVTYDAFGATAGFALFKWGILVGDRRRNKRKQ